MNTLNTVNTAYAVTTPKSELVLLATDSLIEAREFIAGTDRVINYLKPAIEAVNEPSSINVLPSNYILLVKSFHNSEWRKVATAPYTSAGWTDMYNQIEASYKGAYNTKIITK